VVPIVIPYWSYDPLIQIGPLEIRAFGVLAAVAIAVGSAVASRRARERGIEKRELRGAVAWLLVGGFLGAHFLAIFAYEPHRLADDPWLVVKVWDGLASFGGFLGAFVGLALYTKKNALPFGVHADSIALGFIPGWVFGRLGCFTAHDHPGTHTDFFLAVRYPDGPRHDLGFYELLWMLVLFGVFEWLRRRPMPPGRLCALLGLLYAPVRFALDFLRAVDVRYFGLTPAQYACVLLFGFCVGSMVRGRTPSAITAAPRG
jgi:phosphatidylglycerol:prolipoprotein diacylglycerol transferase